MNARILAFATLSFIVACSEPDEAAEPSLLANRGETTLTGNWQVAAVDGEPTIGVRLTGTSEILGWAPSCAGWVLRYQQSGRSIQFSRTENPDEITTVCAVGYPEKLPQIFSILPGLRRIETKTEGKLLLSGNGHSLTLERPVSRSAIAVPSLQGTWRVSSLNGDEIPEGVAPTFVGDEDMISWSVRCAQQDRIYQIENDRFVTRKPKSMVPPPPPPLQVSRPTCALGLPPHLEEAFMAMDAAVKISRSERSGIKLEGGNRSLTLHPINFELEGQ